MKDKEQEIYDLEQENLILRMRIKKLEEIISILPSYTCGCVGTFEEDVARLSLKDSHN